MKTIIFFLFCLSSIIIPATSRAQSVNDAGEAYAAGNYAEAVRISMLPENINNIAAQYLIGLAYRDGHAVEQSYSEAAKWWKKSGEIGNGNLALIGLAELYREGKGVPLSYQKTFALANQATNYGSAAAHAYQGKLYHLGIGTPRNNVKALEHLETAYHKGNFDNLDILADIYRQGLAGKRQPDAAAFMYRIDFRKNGRQASQLKLLSLAAEGGEYAKFASLLSETNAVDHASLTSLANQGNGYAQCHLGLIYLNGQRVEKDFAKTRDLFERSIANGNLACIFRLGGLHANGTGVDMNHDRATELLERTIKESKNYAFNSPQNPDLFKKEAEKALKIVRENKVESARIAAVNREIRRKNAEIREYNARIDRENAARAAAAKRERQQQNSGQTYTLQQGLEDMSRAISCTRQKQQCVSDGQYQRCRTVTVNVC